MREGVLLFTLYDPQPISALTSLFRLITKWAARCEKSHGGKRQDVISYSVLLSIKVTVFGWVGRFQFVSVLS